MPCALQHFTRHFVFEADLSVKCFQQISVEEEEDRQHQNDACKARKLCRKAEFALSPLAQSHRSTQTERAEEEGGCTDNRYDPSDNAQKSFVCGAQERADKQTQGRQKCIYAKQNEIDDPASLIQFTISDTLCFFRTDGKQKSCYDTDDCFNKIIIINKNAP